MQTNLSKVRETLSSMPVQAQFLAWFCAAGAVEVAVTAFDLVRYISTLSASKLAAPPRTAMIILFAVLLALWASLLGASAWRLTRVVSYQKIVSRWSLAFVIIWTFVLAGTMLVNYPVPAQAHHLDKFFLCLLAGLAWNIWFLVHPASLDRAAQTRSFQWLKVGFINLMLFLLLGEAAARGLDPLLARSGLFGDKHTPANLTPHFPVKGSIGFTNSQGFRDREHAVQRPGAGLRIIALGDSFTWGAGVSYDEAFVTLLERRLQVVSKEAEVVNLGVPAWGPHEEFHLLKTYGIRFTPDLVILNFFVGNDIQNKRGDDVYLPRLLLIAGQSYYVHSNGNWLHDTFAPDRWYLYHDLNYLLKVGGATMWRRFEKGDGKSVTAGDDAPLVPHDYYLRGIRERSDIYLTEDTPFFRHHWTRTQETLLAMQQYLDQRGIPFLVVIIPDHVQLDRILQKEYLATAGEAAARYDFNKPQRLLLPWCRSQGISAVDLQPAFEAAGHPELLYFRNDFHLTALGHRLAADVIFEALQGDPGRLTGHGSRKGA